MSENCLMVERKSTHCKGNKNAKTEPTHAVTNSVFSHTHTHRAATHLHTHTLAQTAVSVHTHVYLLGFPTHTHPTTTKTGIQGQMVVWVLWAIQIRVSYSTLPLCKSRQGLHTFGPYTLKTRVSPHTQNNTITNTGPTTHTQRHNLGLTYADAQVAGAAPHRTPLRNHYHRRPPPQAPSPRPRRYVTTRCRGCWEM